MEAVIPRIFHHIWVGPNPLPDEYRDYRETWRHHHPDWEMHLWTEDNLPTDLVRKEAYERLRRPAERSDIIRLEMLLRFGGLYVDTDVECLRSIEPLLEGIDFCTSYNRPGMLSNAFIGASPGHPILEQAVRELRPVKAYGIDKWGTGPYFISKVLRQHPEVTILPPEYFQPGDGAYAINHHAHSWKAPEEWRDAFFKCELKLEEARSRIKELERSPWRRFRRSRRRA